MRAKWIRVVGWIALVLAAVFFMWNGMRKLMGDEQMISMFQALGYPDWARYAVGAAELAGGLCLLIPQFSFGAAVLLGCLMIGAVISEWLGGHRFEALIPGQWLIVLAVIAFVRMRYRVRKKNEQ